MPGEVPEDRQQVASPEVEVGLVPLLQIRQTDRLLQALAEELQQRVQEEPGVARTYQVGQEQLGVVRTCSLLAVVGQEELGVAHTCSLLAVVVEEEQLGVARTCPLLAVVAAAADPSFPLVVAAVVAERYS